jgi:D-alanine-D-alanine ligase
MGRKSTVARPIGRAAPDRSGARSERRRRGVRTLGPISDLEPYLAVDWWRTLFNSLYLETDGDVFENDRNTVEEVNLLIGSAGLARDNRILDLCCGQGRHALELAQRGFGRVTGLDRSRYLIRLARQRARQRHLQVSFHEGDARRFRLGFGEFDCACILGNSFGYFARAEDDLAMLAAARKALAAGGVLVMDLMDGEWMRCNFEPRSWEWLDRNHFVCRERSLAADRDRLISREIVIDAERGVIADQFYAERLYTKERLAALLIEAGFANLRFHRVPAPASQRNQDLGMVAQRLFLTCERPGRQQPTSRRSEAIPQIMRMRGDPGFSDGINRSRRFDAEDITAINLIKVAPHEATD